MSTKNKRGWIFLFALPCVILFCIVYAIPFIMVMITSLCNYTLTQSPTFLGLDNFKTIFADQDFRVSIINTLKWVVIQSTLHVLMGFIMALILRRKPKGWKFARVAYVNEELKRNYDFYQTVTLHHSSLSTCIFGILASQIGYDDEAYKYFSQSARMDLDDIHNNFYAGIHAANMAGTWQGIVFGFAGVRSNAGYLQINPKLPGQWKSYEFRLQYKGSGLNIKVTDKKVEYTLLNDCELSYESLGEKIVLSKEGDKYVQEI